MIDLRLLLNLTIYHNNVAIFIIFTFSFPLLMLTHTHIHTHTHQVVPNYSSRDMYEKQFAMGVSMYGQMTAGSYCYIGPQGIVHGTTVSVRTG